MRSKVEFFKDLFIWWCGKLDLPFNIQIKEDLNLNAPACIEHTCTKFLERSEIVLLYNPKYIQSYTRYILINIVLHEIGHLVFFVSNETEEEQINCEYLAEIFAICLMKLYYKKEYKQFCKHISRVKLLRKTKKRSPIHYEAFKKIEEYKLGG